jgi:hypothetical protein
VSDARNISEVTPGVSSGEKRMYRVRWQREGQTGKRARHFETLTAAERCAERQITAHDDIAEWFTDESTGYAVVDWSRVPKVLVWGPEIDSRIVGGWELFSTTDDTHETT